MRVLFNPHILFSGSYPKHSWVKVFYCHSVFLLSLPFKVCPTLNVPHKRQQNHQPSNHQVTRKIFFLKNEFHLQGGSGISELSWALLTYCTLITSQKHTFPYTWHTRQPHRIVTSGSQAVSLWFWRNQCFTEAGIWSHAVCCLSRLKGRKSCHHLQTDPRAAISLAEADTEN